jgi:NAD+ kinase
MNDRIVLCPNPYRDRSLELTTRAGKLLADAGFRTVVSPVFVELPEHSALLPLSQTAPEAAMILSFGGDGTFLHVARAVMGRDVPLLGVNLGTKGFMASLEPSELELIVRAARGEYRRSYRMLLDVELVREGEVIFRDTALNDAVVKSDVNCIGLRVSADGVGISCFAGDGVIVATPTGSTAYSMSAGGPIVEPEAADIIVTPICAHVMAAKSFILSPQREIVVTPDRLRGRRAALSVDGSDGIPLTSGDAIRLRRSDKRLLVADLGVRSFYETAFGKLTDTTCST